MKTLLAAALLGLAASASANPMLDKCLSYAPKECALKETSSQAEFLTCFKDVELKLSVLAQRACAEELTHAKVHRDCGKDIKKLCAEVKPGQGKTMSCLGNSRLELRKACRQSLEEWELSSGQRKKGRKDFAVGAVRC